MVQGEPAQPEPVATDAPVRDERCPKASQVVHNDESDSTEQNEPKVNCSNVETRAKGETSERAIVEDATGSDAEVSSDDDPEGQLVAAKVQRKVQKLVAKEFERMYVAAWEAIPTETDVEEYEQQLEIRRELKQEKKVKQMRKRHIYKYGRYLMIFLGIFGIPVDLWKGYQGVEMHPRALEAASAAEVYDFYSSVVAMHVVSTVAAIEHNAAMVVISRLVSTYLYQKDYSSKNSSAPTDPKELQKYIRQKVESGEIRRDRLPKGYTFPKEEDEVQQESMMGDDEDMLPPNLRDLNRKMGKKGKKGDRGKGKKGPKKQAAGKGKGSKGTKTAKGSTKATKKSKATKKPKKPISSGKP